ncbi:MAG: TetR/AcrR family transcriptional regulator [Mycobacterium sp.]|nr:TetR/AcrR family transcriptional regulator [Mycobacterium sp.]
MNANDSRGFGTLGDGGSTGTREAGTATLGPRVDVSLICEPPACDQRRGNGVYHHVLATVPFSTGADKQEETVGAPRSQPDVQGTDFRRRLLDGLATSIEQRGYRETTVADIVRAARTSKRTFYDHFSSKEECLVELLSANNDDLVAAVRGAVDPEAEWTEQVRQAMTAFVTTIDATPEIALSWIRELPALGQGARPMLRRGLTALTEMIVALSDSPGFRRAGVRPLSPTAAVILVGGLRELTAQTVEDGTDMGAILEPAVAVSTALLRAGT